MIGGEEREREGAEEEEEIMREAINIVTFIVLCGTNSNNLSPLHAAAVICTYFNILPSPFFYGLGSADKCGQL